MIYGADISNLQGPPASYRGQQWYRDAEFVIVQCIQPPQPYAGWNHTDAVTGLRGYTGEQLQAARDDGKKVGVYAFLWNTIANPYADILARLNIVPANFPLDMRPWVDVEDTTPQAVAQRRNAVTQARTAADEFAKDRNLPPSGGYSGPWYLSGYLSNWWPDGWLKWWADYGKAAGSLLGGGCVGHQYASSPVDSDVLMESEIISGGKLTNMAIKVGPGMQAQMDANNDAPLNGHKFYEEMDDEGNSYSVEECYGTKGKYVSSNSSGQWVNAGPI